MARARRRKPHRSWPQRVLLGLNVLLVIACIGAAAALTKVRTTLEQVPVVDIGSALTETATDVTDPRNFLIIGTDSAARLDKSDPVTKGREEFGQLADVIMIMRVDPTDNSAKLISIPRDSRVALAPDGHMDRINAAIAGSNGPRNLVQTIKRNFGISIDNYVQVDFEAFRDLVDVLGSVPVYFTTPVRDKNTGLDIDSPGCKQLGPVQALAYARARHFQFQEGGKWKTDGTGDLGRITRQQDFIKRAMRKASEKGIRNPNTAIGLVDAASAAVTMDDTLNAGTILDLLTQFRNFNPDSLKSQQIPTETSPRDGVAYQDVIWSEAEALLDPFRGVVPGQPLAPKSVIVDVTGTAQQSAALSDVSSKLDSAGFDAEPVESRKSSSATTITYGPKGRDAAILLARQLEVIPKLVEDSDISGYRVVLNVGKAAPVVRAEALPVEQLPAALKAVPSTTPEKAPAAAQGEAASDESSTTVPSTTIDPSADPDNANQAAPPGIVPTDPVKAAACR